MKEIRVALAFKDFASWTGYSSVGLNVAAIITAEELCRNGIPAEIFSVRHNVDLFYKIRDAQESDKPLTHVVILAPWITPVDLEALLKYFPHVQFAVQSHCNVGGLHGDHRGVGNFRNYADLAFSYPNLSLAGNSRPFVEWLSRVYGLDVFLLPNLYSEKSKPRKPIDRVRPVRIGAFGALRLEKNFITAAAAAMIIHSQMDQMVELHLNAGGETDGQRIISTIRQMSDGVPGFSVITHRWQPWSEFLKLVGRMDLLIQPSFTESFNIVTADGVSEGVPSVVSSAIKWAPDSWKADSDDAIDVARVGLHLLKDAESVADGVLAIRRNNEEGVKLWERFIERKPLTFLQRLIKWF